MKSKTISSRRSAAGDDTGEAAPLFRVEVLEEQQVQWMGTVLLKPRSMHVWFGACAAFTAALVLLALALGSYTKKARVPGWLVPEQGLVRVHAPRAGVATRLLVQEGDPVEQGQALLALSSEERSAAFGDTQARVAHALQVQRASIGHERERSAQLFAQQRTTLAGRLQAAQAEQRFIEQEIALQRSRSALALEAELRLAGLQARGFVPAQQAQAAAEAQLEQTGKLRALERSLAALVRQRLELEGELRDLPLKMAAQDALLERGAAGMTRELAEAEARRELLVPAPHSGTVTAVHASAGAAVHPGSPLLSIVPRGVRLEAHLYAPSRAIGFIRPQQPVLLRFQAYPYQKFGHYAGIVKSISRTGMAPSELPAPFAGMSASSAPGQALYRITVTLARQDVTAYGKPEPLQSGMQLDADVMLERRRLFEWLLDPVFTLTGR